MTSHRPKPHKARKACSPEDTRQPHFACEQIPRRSRISPSFFTLTLSILTPPPEPRPLSSTSLLVESPFQLKHSGGGLMAVLSAAVTCEPAPTTPLGKQKPLPRASNQHTHAVGQPNRQYAVFWAFRRIYDHFEGLKPSQDTHQFNPFRETHKSSALRAQQVYKAVSI